jgi:hypothetical protein
MATTPSTRTRRSGTSYDQGNSREFLHKYPHDFVLVDPQVERGCKLMNAQKDWKLIYRDHTCPASRSD